MEKYVGVVVVFFPLILPSHADLANAGLWLTMTMIGHRRPNAFHCLPWSAMAGHGWLGSRISRGKYSF